MWETTRTWSWWIAEEAPEGKLFRRAQRHLPLTVRERFVLVFAQTFVCCNRWSSEQNDPNQLRPDCHQLISLDFGRIIIQISGSTSQPRTISIEQSTPRFAPKWNSTISSAIPLWSHVASSSGWSSYWPRTSEQSRNEWKSPHRWPLGKEVSISNWFGRRVWRKLQWNFNEFQWTDLFSFVRCSGRSDQPAESERVTL